ncbi:hypothetical protein SAMN05880574_102160 [Chryseobacterium sp. RU37D]|uniref:hypothetical protein n=1 Tax=Chryseobacterium sp. RU37D TaxID=1907397 RepID=UPI0009554A98|nr:hypothetical protein [Chryseobacterium sp. RU37D]SIP93340.1 hypothetical protein SAMN05880574_102160 [Chryseobacterium sp. RU37D]
MFKIIDEKINGFLFVIIFPFLLFFISYYGFETSYVVGIKSWEKAPDFMFSSVYAYRVIPNYLSVRGTEILGFIIDYYLPFAKNFLLKQGSIFYHTTFLINVFFFVLTSVVLDLILKLKPVEFLLNGNVSRMMHLIAVFFVVIMQYVPTNCDCIAMFFYVWGMFFTLKYLQNRKPSDLIGLSVIIFISTFIRETACLNIAFFATVFIDFNNIKERNFAFVKETIFLIIAFVLPYIGLRLIIHQQASFVEGIYLVKNFTSPYNLMGLLFGFLSVYLSYHFCDETGKIMIKKYLFFASPYIIMITLVGLFWETRLFMPLILTGIVTASYQFKKYHI